MRPVLTLLCLVFLPSVAAANPSGKRITLEVHKAEVHGILRMLADAGRLNLVVGEDVKGTVSLHLRNVPWSEALDAVLALQGLGSERRGSILRVAPLKQLAEEAETRAKIAALKEQSGPLVTHIIPVNYARAAELAPLVKATLSERGTVAVDVRTNSLIVRDVELSGR